MININRILWNSMNVYSDVLCFYFLKTEENNNSPSLFKSFLEFVCTQVTSNIYQTPHTNTLPMLWTIFTLKVL